METAIEFTINNTIGIGLTCLICLFAVVVTWGLSFISIIMDEHAGVVGFFVTGAFSWIFEILTTITSAWFIVGVVLNIIQYFTQG